MPDLTMTASPSRTDEDYMSRAAPMPYSLSLAKPMLDAGLCLFGLAFPLTPLWGWLMANNKGLASVYYVLCSAGLLWRGGVALRRYLLRRRHTQTHLRRTPKRFFLFCLMLAFCLPIAAQTLDMCTVTGRAFLSSGAAAKNKKIRVVKVVKDGAVISEAPVEVFTDSSGDFTLSLPQGSIAYIYAEMVGLSARGPSGVPLSVPSSSSATLSTLVTTNALPAILPVAAVGGGGSGTVTSFSAGDLSPLFTTTESTATTTPALTFSLTAQSANRVLAGPTTGSAAAPTFRALVAADLPALAISGVTGLQTALDAKAATSSLATVATTGAYADLSGKPTLGTAAALNVAASGDAASGEVVKGNDSRLSDSRTPTAHNQPWSTITGTPTTLSGYSITDAQPLDADLTIYAGITPSANIQSLLGAANYAAMRTQLGIVIGTDVQAYDADLSTYAGITPSVNVQTLLGAADYAAMRSQLGLVIGTNVQAYDADLATYAGITPSANVQSLLGAASYSAMRTQLGLVIGTDVQALLVSGTNIKTINSTSLLGSGDISISGGSPAGSSGDFQYNNGGSFGAAVIAQSSGRLTATPTAASSGVASYFRVITPADTTLTASTESIGAQFGGNTSAATVTRQWAAGALATQRENVFVAPTIAFTSASTATTVVNLEAASPIAGTNATLTNSYAARFVASSAAHVPLVAKGAASQSAPYQLWQNSSGVVQASMSPSSDVGSYPGTLNVGRVSTTTLINDTDRGNSSAWYPRGTGYGGFTITMTNDLGVSFTPTNGVTTDPAFNFTGGVRALQGTASAATGIAVFAQAAASNSAAVLVSKQGSSGTGDGLQIQNSSGAVLAAITSAGRFQVGASGAPVILSGTGAPESAVTAPVGSLYLRSDGGAGTSFCVKESGTGNTGWACK